MVQHRPLFAVLFAALVAALAFVALVPAARPAAAQAYVPPPVDLGIPNVAQETQVWCWAAVAEQVIRRQRGHSPPQCALVAMVHGQFPSYCCPHYERCAVAGSLAQIQQLIRNFGHRYSAIQGPGDPMNLYRHLQAGRPIILAIRNAAFSGHVVVLTGMTWVVTERGLEAVLHINDPIHSFPPRMYFRDLAPRWAAAIVVY
jgi:hypothetical protein